MTNDSNVPESNLNTPVVDAGLADATVIDTQVIVEQDPESGKNRALRAVLIVTAILLALLLCVAGLFLARFLGLEPGEDKEVGGITWLRSIYAIGEKPEDDISPASASVSADGETWWIADQGNGRIFEVRNNLAVTDVVYGDAANEAFLYPSRIFVARDGRKIIPRATHGDIWVLDQDNNRLLTLTVPDALAVAANDDIIVVGTRNGFVAFQRDGTLIGTVGTQLPGKDQDQFDGVNGLWVDEESNVYAVDTSNNRLSKYDENGDRVWIVELGQAGNLGENLNMDEKPETDTTKFPAALQFPVGITMDAAGRLIVADMLDFTLAAFNAEDGSFIDKWGTFGAKDGYLNYPTGISYNASNDTFMVTEVGGAGRAQIIKLPGSGGSVLTDIRSALNGPLGACLFPLLILIILAILYWVAQRVKRRREERLEQSLLSPEEIVDSTEAA